VRRAGIETAGRFRLGRWTIDVAQRDVTSAAGDNAALTRGEFDLLTALLRANGRVVSRDRLSAALNGGAESDIRSVDALISRIRRKLGNAESGELISTIPGVGYRCAALRDG
jgi:DNA-binding response OmpR family regulator